MKDDKPRPEIEKVTNLINEIFGKCISGENYIFRGTPQIYSKEKKGISSSLYRKNKDIFNEHYKPTDMESEIVKKARRLFPPHTNDLEILTDLRHFGGKINLIDFTQNLHIALFFACNGSFDKDGEVILFNKDRNQQFEVKEPVKTQTSQKRVIAQDSVFLSVPEGYIELEKGSCESFQIQKGLKEEIVEYLQNFHNISVDTMYNDIVGFIANNEENYGTAITHFHRGNLNSNSKKYAKAIKEYDQAIRINPQFAQAYYNRGNASAALGKHSEAIADYDKAIRINPQFSEAYRNRGSKNADLGEHSEAIADYDKAIQINPQFSEAYFNRGNANKALGKHSEAIADYDKAIQINPQFAEAYYNRGIANAALEKYTEAIADYDRVIQINPKHAMVYNSRGIANAGLEKYSEAITDFDQAIQINPKDAQAYYNRGIINAVLGKHPEAKADYEKAIEIDPQLASKSPP